MIIKILWHSQKSVDRLLNLIDVQAGHPTKVECLIVLRMCFEVLFEELDCLG